VTSAGEVRLRRAGPDDVEHVKRCIYHAQELYRRLGHRELARDERGVLMALDL
jgi:hypothetical protein